MALPALDDIRRAFADATLAVAARATLAGLFERVPGVDQVVPLAGGGRTSGREAAAALREGRFDAAILLPNSFRAAWLARRAGIPQRWGYRADWRGPLLTRRVRRPRGTVHQGTYYQRLVAGLGIANGPLRPYVEVGERDKIAGAALLGRDAWPDGTTVVGLAPGAAYGFAKQWPPDRFARLASALAAQGIWSVLVGLPADRPAGRDLVEAFERSAGASERPGRVVNLIGRTELGELVGVLAQMSAVVANDSGAAHLAGAVGVPVVALFGPTDERVGAPLAGRTATRPTVTLSQPVFCRPCGLRECPIDHRCMKRIEPGQVVQAVLAQLDGRRG